VDGIGERVEREQGAERGGLGLGVQELGAAGFEGDLAVDDGAGLVGVGDGKDFADAEVEGLGGVGDGGAVAQQRSHDAAEVGVRAWVWCWVWRWVGGAGEREAR
jgi:hypothetical protein